MALFVINDSGIIDNTKISFNYNTNPQTALPPNFIRSHAIVDGIQVHSIDYIGEDNSKRKYNNVFNMSQKKLKESISPYVNMGGQLSADRFSLFVASLNDNIITYDRTSVLFSGVSDSAIVNFSIIDTRDDDNYSAYIYLTNISSISGSPSVTVQIPSGIDVFKYDIYQNVPNPEKSGNISIPTINYSGAYSPLPDSDTVFVSTASSRNSLSGTLSTTLYSSAIFVGVSGLNHLANSAKSFTVPQSFSSQSTFGDPPLYDDALTKSIPEYYLPDDFDPKGMINCPQTFGYDGALTQVWLWEPEEWSECDCWQGKKGDKINLTIHYDILWSINALFKSIDEHFKAIEDNKYQISMQEITLTMYKTLYPLWTSKHEEIQNDIDKEYGWIRYFHTKIGEAYRKIAILRFKYSYLSTAFEVKTCGPAAGYLAHENEDRRNILNDPCECGYLVQLIAPDNRVDGFHCPSNEYILDRAESKGVMLPYSCRAGACSSCIGVVVSGTVDQPDQSFLDDSQIAEGYVLTCVAFPTSDCIIQTYKEEDFY